MKTKFILTTLTCLMLISCERDEPDIIGPSLNDIFGDFFFVEEFEKSRTMVDFADGQDVQFTATFSKQVQWELEIQGLESGAVRMITGTSTTLDASNATWTGSVSELPMFREELCAVALRIPSDSVEVLDTLGISGIREIQGTVVADFEEGIQAGWNIFAQSGANMSFVIREDIPAAQGSKYYDMGGEVTWDFLIGLMDFPASAYEGGTFGLSTVPDDVFFNVMLNKPVGITNEIVLFQFREDDNGDGQFSEGSEDMWSLELRGLDEQWKLTSLRYSDMTALVNGQPAQPAGNAIHEPDKLHQISVLFLADPATGYSQTLMDYLIFTEGGPLQP